MIAYRKMQMDQEIWAPYLTHLLEDTCREECHNGDESDDTHVPDIFLNFAFDTPQRDGDKGDKCDPVLLEREGFSRRANGLDLNLALAIRGARGLIRNKKQEPN